MGKISGRKRRRIDWSDSRKNRIGIFGGSFNPIHTGHLTIADKVAKEFGLKKVIFIPTFLPPHKETKLPFPLRYKMVKLAIRGRRNFKVSTIEKNLAGLSYTIKTIRHFKKIYKKAELFLIIGSDQFAEINTWFKPHAIFKECRVIVVPRPGYRVSARMPYFKDILIARIHPLKISSSEIRQRIKEGRRFHHLVPRPVYLLIKERNLYQ